jgi:hypothetical protein
MKEIDCTGKRVLFISDTHIPYSVSGYLQFLKKLKDEFKPDVVIHGGDEVDYHAISFHDSIGELFSAGHELDQAIIEIQEGLHKLFPKLYLLESNHGSLVTRKMKHHGIPIRVLKPLNELYETPLWEWHEKIKLKTSNGDVVVAHGMSGVAGAWMKLIGCSTVEFHFHTKFHITWIQTIIGKKFSMHCGCLADRESMAMSYAKSNMAEFINGTGAIDENGFPILFPMIN